MTAEEHLAAIAILLDEGRRILRVAELVRLDVALVWSMLLALAAYFRKNIADMTGDPLAGSGQGISVSSRYRSVS